MPDVMAPSALTGATVQRLPRTARLLLRGDPVVLGRAFQLDLPTRPCTSLPGDRSALWLGPDEWLVLAPASTVWPNWEDDRGAAVDVGHRQVGFVVQGPQAADALAVACPLDLALSAFRVGACARTVFGKAEIVLWRRDQQVFHLEVWRSFAAYVEQLLAEGVREACAQPGAV
jgi:sarcosine oxidase, subunit gamma